VSRIDPRNVDRLGARLAMVCAVVIAGSAAACRDPGREARERREREESQRLRDRASLEQLLEADRQVDRILQEADDLARTDEAAAADLLEKQASPTAEVALTIGDRVYLETPWAAARRDELMAVLRDRKEAIPAYATALRGTDIDQKLAAVERELALERRAIEAVEHVTAGRDGGA